MNPWPYDSRQRRDAVALPVIWLTVLLSIVLHGVLLWGWKLKMPEPTTQAGDTLQKLRLRLAPRERDATPPPGPPPSSASRADRPPGPAARAPQSATPVPKPAAPVPKPAAPVLQAERPPQAPLITSNQPAPSTSAPTPPAVAAAPRPPAMAGDMLSFIEARRRARASELGAATNAAPAEDENARRNRIAAANIAAPNAQVFGYDPKKSGGIFQVETVTLDYAEFLFFGWNKDIARRTSQRIEVRRGANNDIRIAIVRKMIAIIREHEQGDFVWHSNRLGRDLNLSARPADSAGLEDVLFREFFSGR